MRKPALSFLFILSLLGGLPAWGLTCESVFQTELRSEDFLQTDNKGAQRFLQLVRRGLVARYEKDPEVKSLIESLVNADLSRGEASFEIKWGAMSAKIVKSRFGKSVSYRVPNLVVAPAGKALQIGERPKTLNTDFARILAALVGAARRDAEKDSGIERVEMWAGMVMNLHLVDLLKETGFARRHDPLVGLMNGQSRYNDVMTYGNHMGFHDVGFGRMMPGDYMSPSVRRIQEETGYDWSLSFSVKRKP